MEDPPEPGLKEAAEILPQVYEELKRLASHRMSNETPGNTLQATALVHEAYLRLTPADKDPLWENQAHFFGAAAEAMRRILIDRARNRSRLKRGGDLHQTVFEQSQIEAPAKDSKLLEVDESLERFAEVDPSAAELVKLRYFVGLTLEEIAEVSGSSLSTIKREWSYSRAWLKNDLRVSRGEGGKRKHHDA